MTTDLILRPSTPPAPPDLVDDITRPRPAPAGAAEAGRS